MSRPNGILVGVQVDPAIRFSMYFSPGGVDECWEWRGYKRGGYGNFMSNRKNYRAHRFAWELANGRPVPDGMVVIHSCDNPPCVNPAHLSVGTAVENRSDCVRKGRQASLKNGNHGRHTNPERFPRGEAHPNAKLTEEVVREIKRRWLLGDVTQTQIARDIGIAQARVSEIVLGKNWRHVA